MAKWVHMKNILYISVILILGSCSTKNTDTNPKLVKSSRIQKHIIEKDLEYCESCILGSVGDEKLKASDKKIYLLTGAEELNLENIYFDIPVTYNRSVKKWVKYFTGRGRKIFLRYAQRAGRYGPVLSKILNDQGLPRDLIYLAMAESGFNNRARSWAKAVGPWQFMPFTGRRFGLEVDFYLDERRDPLKATVASSMYLRALYDMFGSWELACAGYNAGEGKIKRAIKRYRTKDFWKIARGRYLRPETKNYVPKIMALAIIGKNLKTFGMYPVEFDKALDFEEITVPGNSDLYKIAQALETTFEEMKIYNPEVTRWQTPPDGEEYVIRVKVGKKKIWDKYEIKPNIEATDYKLYSLRGFANLKQVGRKFKVPYKVLEALNDMSASTRLKPRTSVVLPFRDDHNPKKVRMYADLYQKPRKSVVRRRTYQKWIKRGRRNGSEISNPTQFYIVKKGDTLWSISRKTGVNINTIIRTNYKLVKRRMILPGDKLAIK